MVKWKLLLLTTTHADDEEKYELFYVKYAVIIEEKQIYWSNYCNDKKMFWFICKYIKVKSGFDVQR